MAVNTYLSIITLNVTGLNALIKRQSGSLEEKTKKLQFAAFRRLTSGWKIHIDWKGMEKENSCKWKQQESGGNNTPIRQNRL